MGITIPEWAQHLMGMISGIFAIIAMGWSRHHCSVQEEVRRLHSELDVPTMLARAEWERKVEEITP